MIGSPCSEARADARHAARISKVVPRARRYRMHVGSHEPGAPCVDADQSRGGFGRGFLVPYRIVWIAFPFGRVSAFRVVGMPSTESGPVRTSGDAVSSGGSADAFGGVGSTGSETDSFALATSMPTGAAVGAATSMPTGAEAARLR